MAKKQKNYRTDKKSDSARRAKPSGYRYKVGNDKDHPLYYKKPTKDEIEKYLAGDAKWKNRIYYEGRVERADSNQKKKLEKGGFLSRLFKKKKVEPKVEYVLNVYEADGSLRSNPIFPNKQVAEHHEKDYIKLGYKTKVEPVKMKNGGSVKNDYEGKEPSDIWDSWTKEQRSHFLSDHFSNEDGVSTLGKTFNAEKEITLSYDNLSRAVQNEIWNHVTTGQYKKGGAVKRTKDAIAQDKRKKAKKAGKRTSKDGNTYYEKRVNRSDKDLRKRLKTGGDVDKPSSGLYVAIGESKDGYWTIVSKPTSKEKAESMLGGITDNEKGKVVSLEDAKAHKKVIGAEYLEEISEPKKAVDTTGKIKTISGISHSILREPIDHIGMLKIEFSHPLGTVYSDGKYGYVQSGYDWLRFDIIDLDDIKKKMEDGGKISGFKLVFEKWDKPMGGKIGTIRTTPENYWVASVLEGNTIDFDSWDAKIKDIDKDKVKELFENGDIPEKEKKADGGDLDNNMTLETGGNTGDITTSVSIIEEYNDTTLNFSNYKQSNEDVIKEVMNYSGRIKVSNLRKLLGRDLDYTETVGSIKLRKPFRSSYFIQVK